MIGNAYSLFVLVLIRSHRPWLPGSPSQVAVILSVPFLCSSTMAHGKPMLFIPIHISSIMFAGHRIANFCSTVLTYFSPRTTTTKEQREDWYANNWHTKTFEAPES